MEDALSLDVFTGAIADAVPAVDRNTTGQYGDGIGSEDEERQLELLLDYLRETDDCYEEVNREVPYPDSSKKCDLILPNGMPIEAKLIRYWRANGDPEPAMYGHVFSPFHQNTLLTDARRLHASGFSERGGLLGLFYTRSDDETARRRWRSCQNGTRRQTLPSKVGYDVDHKREAVQTSDKGGSIEDFYVRLSDVIAK